MGSILVLMPAAVAVGIFFFSAYLEATSSIDSKSRLMSFAERVHAAVINYQTPDLLDTAVRSFLGCCPDVPVLVIDNGSKDASRDVIAALRADRSSVTALLLDENHHHGPAMDLALRRLESDYVFFLDSDTVTHAGDFLKDMLARCTPESVYGAGKVTYVNRRGFAEPVGIPVLVSAFMLIDRAMYLQLPPFVHHGLPALQNFKAAYDAGHKLVDFPIDDYVEHLGRGTAGRYGYGLGLKGRIDYVLNKLGL